DQQPEHVSVRPALHALAVAEVEDRDAGQDDLAVRRRHAHELAAVRARHREADDEPVAVLEDLVELELRRVERGEDALVEAAHRGLVHRLGRVAVEADAPVVELEVTVEVAGVPGVLRPLDGRLVHSASSLRSTYWRMPPCRRYSRSRGVSSLTRAL